jgi:hypothetical protein
LFPAHSACRSLTATAEMVTILESDGPSGGTESWKSRPVASKIIVPDWFPSMGFSDALDVDAVPVPLLIPHSLDYSNRDSVYFESVEVEHYVSIYAVFIRRWNCCVQ